MQPSDILWVPANWLIANGAATLAAAVALIVGHFAARLAARGIKRLLPRAPGVDANFAPLLAQAAYYGIQIFAIVTALSFLGVANTSILAVLGAAGLAVALALQGTLANIAAGIMLIWLRPIAIGEYITADGIAGVVVEIGLFGTRLRSTSGLYIFTPNQKLWSSAITNHSREPRRRIDVNLTVPESADLAAARALLLDLAKGDNRVLADPDATVHVDSLAGDKVVLQLRAWVATPHYLDALRHLTEQTRLAMNEQLAAGQGGEASVGVAADPHAAADGFEPPGAARP